MRGFLKATTVLSTLSSLTILAYYFGLLGSIRRVSQSGYFSTQSAGFTLSIGVVAGFMMSFLIVRVFGKNTPGKLVEDPTTTIVTDPESPAL